MTYPIISEELKQKFLCYYGVVVSYSEQELSYYVEDGILSSKLSGAYRFQEIDSVLKEAGEMILYHRTTGFVTLWRENKYVNYRGWRYLNG